MISAERKSEKIATSSHLIDFCINIFEIIVLRQTIEDDKIPHGRKYLNESIVLRRNGFYI